MIIYLDLRDADRSPWLYDCRRAIWWKDYGI